MTFKSKLHRAAVLVKSLNQQQAERLLARLEPEELTRLSAAIDALDSVDDNQQRLARKKFIEFARRFKSQLPRQHQAGEHELPFAFLVNADKALRHALLVDEHPKMVAVILSLLPIQTASETLNSFEPVQRVAILRRLCRHERMQRSALEQCSNAMKARMNNMLFQSCCDNGGLDVASRLLSCSDVSTRESLLDYLDGSERRLAADLKAKLIHFDTLMTLSDADLKTVLARTDTSLWAPALVHAPSEIRHRIFDNLARKPSEILHAEIREAAQVDFLVGSNAQAAIVASLLQLADAGLIRLPTKPKRAA